MTGFQQDASFYAGGIGNDLTTSYIVPATDTNYRDTPPAGLGNTDTLLETQLANALEQDPLLSAHLKTYATTNNSGLGDNVWSNFLGTFNAGNRIPTTLSAFIADFQSYLNTNMSPNAPIPSDMTEIKNQLEGIIAGYSGMFPGNANMFINMSFPVAGTDSPDSTILNGGSSNTLPNVAHNLGITPTQFQTDLINAAWAQFAASYPYDYVNKTHAVFASGAYTENGHTQQSFLTNFIDYFTNFASVSSGLGLNVNGIAVANTDALSFQQIYDGFYPTATQSNFTSFLASYINTIITSGNPNQGFIPGQNIGDFYSKVLQSYTLATGGNTSPATSTVGATSNQTDILNKIFALLVQMIGTLQQVAAAQASNLTFITKWQNAYTNLSTQVHTFTTSDTQAPASGVNQTQRDQLNALNSSFTQNIQSRRSVLQDSSKALQTNLNQSDDSANQQANLCTSIIQELSTLLGAIYR